MEVFKPATGATWSARTGRRTFKGGGSWVWAVKLAFDGKTPAQVRKSLKVTLSDVKGAVIGDGVAVAAREPTSGRGAGRASSAARG